MRLPLVLLLFTLLTTAQTPPPPPQEVDQALRERATQFLQYQVDGSFRKSFDLVAEDTKDWYFAAAKAKLIFFKIESVEYSNDFTQATVKSVTRRNITTMGHSFVLDVPVPDRWKIEDGKWVWYRDTTVINTPFGAVPAPLKGTGPPARAGGGSGLPWDMSPEAAVATANKLMSGASVDRKSITFGAGKTAVEEIVFHNGVPGIVRLVVGKSTPMDSISMDVTDVVVAPEADVRVKVTYTPDDGVVRTTTLRLTVEPFGQVFAIPVTLTAPE